MRTVQARFARGFSSSCPARSYAPLSDIYVLSAARTPVGKLNGGLKSKSAVELGTAAVRAAISRAGIKPESVDEVYMGQVLQGGAGQSPARQVTIAAGCPTTTESTTINKVCASGMKAVMLAAQSLQLGTRKVMVAGGMESMSNAPFYFPRNAAFGNQVASDAIIKDGLWDVYNNFHMGMCAEHCATTQGISREEQDAFAVESYSRATQAWKNNAFESEIVPVELKKGTITVDEEFSTLKLDKVPSLQPAFKKEGGTVTAANASSLNDGASALVLAHKDAAAELGASPLARIVATADAALPPIDFTIAPARAVEKVLAEAGLKVGDIAKWELNEAFAVVGIANTRLLKLDPSKVNVNGGAVALGHPIGSSGSRILVSLIHSLKKGELGCAAICNGGGGSSAVIVERM
ncbi:Acetyl-CoA acetyltransferase [Taphrina deformans PYCC 5710]|uniref:acetyl-CoA C-acetyltransferase n=1 Tax=Taphrina deformans (strain PYCC 5710 / ATCC 11124 / CBS 356.35 / IMI 108563 / JCM 9778 / NBRC 8474) TaxID=1097556 RepID=R4XAI1_TAPDE|nr:Acetyl-CoA acetyltransferase [Taphrina deformans PYCC 5710]|eukprot:CCG82834.1 Acetyl-CoA acetyltransferase [Taphrina deformans PYCC 5710]